MLITPAYAQSNPFGGTDMLTSLLPFVLIFVIMYFLILRPQQKRVKQHAEMVKNVRKGDTVVTSGGLVGRVTKVIDDDQIEVEIADGVRVRQMRQMVTDVRAKGEPVKDDEFQADGVGRNRTATRCSISHGGRRWRRCLTAFLVCLFAVPNFFSDATLKSLPELGAAPPRAWARPAGRLAHPARGRRQLCPQGKGRAAARRRAARAARGARRLHRPRGARADGRGAHPRGERSCTPR